MLYLFNTTIMPNEGVFINQRISAEKALEIFQAQKETHTYGTGIPTTTTPAYISALGHQGSADAFNAMGFNLPWGEIQVNRVAASLQPGDQAICLKLLGRLAEGEIIIFQRMLEIGFEFYLITNIGAHFDEDGSIYNSVLGYLTPTENYVHGK